MKILSNPERETYDSPPRFNLPERKVFFDLPPTLMQIAENLRNPDNRACFIVACGYFRSTKRFFSGKCRQEDIDYVAKKTGLTIGDETNRGHDRYRTVRHRKAILEFYGFKDYDTAAKRFLEKEIEAMVQSQLKPRLIFFRSVDILVEQKVSPPGSSSLTKLILNVLNRHRQSLIESLDRILPLETRKVLDHLTEKVINKHDEPINRYRLTLLKKCSQSTRPTKIREGASDLQLLRSLHDSVCPIVKQLELPHGAIQYFANSVIRSDTFDILRRTEEDRYLHLIAFISHQYFRLQDSLVDAYLNSMHSAINAAQREHKDRCYDRRERHSDSVESLINHIDDDLDFRLEVGRITEEPSWTDSEKVERIRSLVNDNPDRSESVASLKQEIQIELGKDDYYAVLESRSLTMQKRATPILKSVIFNADMAQMWRSCHMVPPNRVSK